MIYARNDSVVNILDKKGPIMANTAADLSESVFASLDAQGHVVEQRISDSENSFIVLTLLAAVSGLALAYLVSRGIVRPIHQTNAMLEDIASGDGDLTKRVPVDSGDEVGELGSNFNRFVEKLQGLIRQIATAVAQLATTAEQLAAVSEETAASSTELAHLGEKLQLLVNQFKV